MSDSANISITIDKKYSFFPFGYFVTSTVWATNRFEPVFQHIGEAFTKRTARRRAGVMAMVLQYTLETQGVEGFNGHQ